MLCFVSYGPAWSSDDRKIINKVLGDIFYKHILWISGSGFWNPIFDMIWHCVIINYHKLFIKTIEFKNIFRVKTTDDADELKAKLDENKEEKWS